MGRHGGLRLLLLNATLLALSVLATLLAAEAVLRIAAHRILPAGEWVSTSTLFEADPVLGVRLRPGGRRVLVAGGAYTSHVRINSLGLRGPEPAARKPENGPRILVLGDSFMFGQGVAWEESFAARIAEHIPGSEAMSAAAPGYSVGQSHLVYRKLGRALNPDLVLLGFFMNDLEEMQALHVERDSRGVPVAYSPRTGEAPVLDGNPAAVRGRLHWLRERSILYALVRSRLDNLLFAIRNPGEPRGASAPPSYMDVFLADPPESVMARWEQAWSTLDALSTTAREGGAALFVFYVPAKWQISEHEMTRWTRHHDRDPADYDRAQPQRMLGVWAASRGVPFMDLLPLFEEHPVSEIYFAHDLHWTERGHALAAEAVAGALRRAGLL